MSNGGTLPSRLFETTHDGVSADSCCRKVDIDCAEAEGFDETDKKFLEELAALLGEACDW